MNNLLKQSLKKLKDKKFSSPELDLRILLNDSSIIKKEIILSNFNLDDIDINKFKINLNRRLKFEPISKIINKKSFWKFDFFVNKNVLDPRPESELIIEETLNIFKDKNYNLKILDVGTGSGCLSVSLAKEYKNSKIKAIDVSAKAIKVAVKNFKKHRCKSQISTKVCKIEFINQKFDLIVSNPPYLSKKEYIKTAKEIKNFEPKIAFLGGNDGMFFYRRFAKIMFKLMNYKSYLIIEIGENQATKCMNLFSNSGLKFVKKVKDLRKKDRILIFSK